MSPQPLPVRWILPLAVVGSLLTICAVGVREARSADGDELWEGDRTDQPLEDSDGLPWDLAGDSDTDTDLGDTDVEDTDAGEETDAGEDDTAEPSAAELAGEVGGFHCASLPAAPLAAWPLLLVLVGLRRRR